MKRLQVVSVLFALTAIIITGVTTQAKDAPVGEEATMEMLGLGDCTGDCYSKLFTPNGFVIAASYIPTDSNSSGKKSVSVSRLFEANNKPFGYTWKPQSANVAKLTQKQIIIKCGNPDYKDTDSLRYGRVNLSFTKDGYLSSIIIRTNE